MPKPDTQRHNPGKNLIARKRESDLLRQAKEDSQKADRARSRFLAAAGHDLRQPLYALSLYAEALRARLGPDGAALASDIKDCIDGLSGLLTDLLDLSKLEAGVVCAKVCDFELAPLLGKLVSRHAPGAQRKGLDLRARPSQLTARTDPVLLGSLIDKLIANAVRFTARGGILIAARRHQDKDWIEVWDTGTGIPAQQQEEIFEAFVRLENDDDSVEKGSGLGLAIVARAAELLGLQLRVRSRVGRGSMFAVEIPCSTRSDLVRTDNRQEIEPLCIGLVANDTAMLRSLNSVLLRLGHQVIAARSSKKLLAQLDTMTPDMVIVDMDGDHSSYDAIVDLRAAFGAILASILVTTNTDPQLVRDMAAHQILVLRKPVELGMLEACIAHSKFRPAP